MDRRALGFALAKGVLAAIGVTLAGMLLLAAAVIFLPVSDGALFAMNQLVKVASIFAGALAAVGAGGQRGFLTGAAAGLLYMVLGYGFYCAFQGNVGAPLVMVGEFFMGAAIGAVSGAVVANMRPRKRRQRAA